MSLADRLGVAELVARKVRLGDRPGAANPERKAMTLISGMLAGADSIDDCDLLRARSTGAVLGHRVMAPSTLTPSPARPRSPRPPTGIAG